VDSEYQNSMNTERCDSDNDLELHVNKHATDHYIFPYPYVYTKCPINSMTQWSSSDNINVLRHIRRVRHLTRL
jgi:hypothetical protein